jgi:hypothetical protein
MATLKRCVTCYWGMPIKMELCYQLSGRPQHRVPYATANSRQFFQSDEFVTISQIWIGVVLAWDRCRNMQENATLKKRDVLYAGPSHHLET